MSIERENDRLKAENEKLISVLHEVEAEAVDAYLCLQHDCELLAGELDDRFRKYWHEQDQNEKLRELCAGLLTGYECGHGELCKGCTWDGLGDPETFPCLPRVKARELGVGE